MAVNLEHSVLFVVTFDVVLLGDLLMLALKSRNAMIESR